MYHRNSWWTTALVVSLYLLPGLGSTARAGDKYQVDPVHSSVVFRVKHMGVGYTYGRFNEVTGTFVIDEQNPAGTTLDIQVKADSLDTNNAKRDEHLKGPDFFNVKEFTTLAFKSRSVRLVKEHTYEVTGDLTLHGVTKPLTVQLDHVGTAQDPRSGVRSGMEGSFTVKRSDFGMGFMVPAIGDDVWILVGLEGVKQ